MIGFWSPRIYNTQFKLKSQIENTDGIQLFLIHGTVSLKPKTFCMSLHFPIPKKDAFLGKSGFIKNIKVQEFCFNHKP